MEAEEDDTLKTSPEGSTAPIVSQQKEGSASAQCEPDTAAQLEEPPLREVESSLPGMEENTEAEDYAVAAGGELMAEPPVAGTEVMEEDGGDGAAVEREPSVTAASSSPVQSPSLVAETDGGPVISGEEHVAAAVVMAHESAGAELEDVSCSGVSEADRKDMEEVYVTAVSDAAEDNQVVVEETGEDTVDLAVKGVDGETTAVDPTEGVENQNEAVTERTELDATEQEEPLHAEETVDGNESALAEANEEGVEAALGDVPKTAEDAGADQMEEVHAAPGEKKEASGVSDEGKEAAFSVEDSIANEMMEVQTKEAHEEGVVAAFGDVPRTVEDAGTDQMEEVHVAPGEKKEASRVPDFVKEAVFFVEDSIANEIMEVETKEAHEGVETALGNVPRTVEDAGTDQMDEVHAAPGEKKEASVVPDFGKEADFSVEDSIANEMMEVETKEAQEGVVAALEDVAKMAEDAGTNQMEEVHAAPGEVQEASGVPYDGKEAAVSGEDSIANEIKVETKEAEDDMLAEGEEAAGANIKVDDGMEDAESNKAMDNMGVGGDDVQETALANREIYGDVLEEAEAAEVEDKGVGHDEAPVAPMNNREVDVDDSEEAEEAVGDDTGVANDERGEAGMSNREFDDDMLEEAEAEAAAAEDMEALHDDTDAAEETDAMEEAEKAEEVNGSGAGMKRKRGKVPKVGSLRTPSRKKMEEDVCFVCFDGGELVLCDRRGCPKAYHPSCVNRDEAFFRTKGQWNCGWHLCSNCGKNAYYMCYTCTYSLCKNCIGDGSISCVRRNKGFCRTCMKTISMIEGEDDTNQVDFDDKGSWEYLFKDYYMDLKERLTLTPEELSRATKLWRGSDELAGNQVSPHEANDDSENSAGYKKATVPKRRQSKRQAKSQTKGRETAVKSDLVGSRRVSNDNNSEWASKELVEFVMHMRNGDRSTLSQFDVQALLLEYIKRNKLRDPKRKSQIICDQRLQNLFGKPRVGHFEMLKLLESHYFLKEDADDLQGTIVDTDANQSEVDGNFDVSEKAGRDKRRKTRKKGDERGLLSNRGDYAAIDTHNINLMYLRRNLLEDLMEDGETFHEKVVGAFVRIRIPGSNQKQDLYRLVPVVGTSKAAEQYKVGKRMTDFVLEILNLNKTEVISIDIISNQEFTEDECKRLRQSIKCGLINRLTVGDILEKTMALQTVRVKDWLETETVRLSHLRDRASDMGRRKELRECIEKLQLLKTPEERQRRLEEIPEIHVDPKMDPSYESEDDEADDRRQEKYMGGARGSASFRSREPISPQKGGSNLYDSWSSGLRTAPMTPSRELGRTHSSRGFSSRGDDYGAESVNESSTWSQVKERETPHHLSGRDNTSMHASSSVPEVSASRIISNPAVSETHVGAPQSAPKVNESEKMWNYQDPAGKIQGPFSIVQLRKWNNTGYFPVDLRIWRATEGQEDSILLTDALNGKFFRDPPSRVNAEPSRGTMVGRAVLSSVDVPKHSGGEWGSSGAGTSLPSPTPGQKTIAAQTRNTYAFSGGNGGAQVPNLASDASNSLSRGAQVFAGSSISAPSQLQSQTTVPGGSYSNQVAGLHNLVQAVAARNQNQVNPIQAGVTAGSVNMHVQAQPQGTWNTSYASYGSSSGPTANPWRPTGSADQSSVQSSAPVPNMNWSYGNNNNNNNAGNNYNATTTQNMGWNQVPAGVGWSTPTPPAQAPAAAAATAQAPAAASLAGNTNMNWGGSTQAAPARNPASAWTAQGQVQAQGNPPQMGWAPTANPSQGYAVQGQGATPTASNVSSSSSAWSAQGNQNGDGSQRNRQWGGRQSSFGGGGGGGGGSSRFGGWCRFFQETGHCKKGASCNYRHT